MEQPVQASFPELSRVLKGRFPFRLACPSFIYPADYLPNVRKLGPYLDEIELLFLEGRHRQHLPDGQLIRRLKSLAGPMDLSYNVHLFTDISLCAHNEQEREQAVDHTACLLSRVESLDPSACVLHLEWQGGTRKEFVSLGLQSLQRLQEQGAVLKRLAIENLESYPAAWIEEILDRSGFGLCCDLGHLLMQGADLLEVYERNRSRTGIMHLHGVCERDGALKDHVGLDRLQAGQLPQIKMILNDFQGVLCLEVFNFEDLRASLAVLEALLD